MVLEPTLADSPEKCCDTSLAFDSRWNVSQFAVHYDVITIDSAFLTSLSTHLLDGSALQMQFKNYNTAC